MAHNVEGFHSFTCDPITASPSKHYSRCHKSIQEEEHMEEIWRKISMQLPNLQVQPQEDKEETAAQDRNRWRQVVCNL